MLDGSCSLLMVQSHFFVPMSIMPIVRTYQGSAVFVLEENVLGHFAGSVVFTFVKDIASQPGIQAKSRLNYNWGEPERAPH